MFDYSYKDFIIIIIIKSKRQLNWMKIIITYKTRHGHDHGLPNFMICTKSMLS